MNNPLNRVSTGSDNDERFRRSSIMTALPLLANAPSIQKLSLKHLPTIDSKRFMRVLDNTVTRVLLVSSFPRIIRNVQEFSLLLGRNATVLFDSYGPLSRAYDEQCAQSVCRPRFANREVQDVHHRWSYLNFEEGLASKLFELTRLLLRELLNNPLAISALIRHRAQWDIEPSGSCRRLAIQLVHLRSLTRNDLLTTPKARARRDEFLERLRRKDTEQRRTIDELEAQFDELQTSQKQQLFERMERLRRIQEGIIFTQSKTQESLQELKQKFDSECRTAKQKHRETMQELTSNLTSCTAQLEEVNTKNLDYERKIRGEKWKVEDAVATILTKMDTDLFEMQAEYDELYEADEIERTACEELMIKLKPIKIRADIVLEEKRLEAERLAAELEEKENQIRAATTIQSLWRSWKARKMIKAERRKNRSGKKK